VPVQKTLTCSKSNNNNNKNKFNPAPRKKQDNNMFQTVKAQVPDWLPGFRLFGFLRMFCASIVSSVFGAWV